MKNFHRPSLGQRGDIIDLQNAINRHIIKNEFPPQRQKLVNNLIDNLQQKDHSNFKLALSTMDGVFLFDPKEIIFCEGESNYTRFHFTAHSPLLVCKTIKEYEDLLQDHQFIRVHKSFLVNRAHIIKMDKDGTMQLTNKMDISVSRRKKSDILKSIKEG